MTKMPQQKKEQVSTFEKHANRHEQFCTVDPQTAF